jgi:hypothetical protein
MSEPAEEKTKQEEKRPADTRKKDEPELREDLVASDSADSFPASDSPPPQRGKEVEVRPADEDEDEAEDESE